MATVREIRRREEAEHGLWPTGARPVNVGEAERFASGIGGVILLASGLKRRGRGGLALVGAGAALVYRGLTGHCSCYQALGASTAESGPADSVPAQLGVRVEEAVTINRPASEIYNFWRDPANLPRFMDHIDSVTPAGADRYHWVGRGPLGRTLEWDAETYNDRPNEMIAWRSLPGGDVDVAGSIHFRPAPGNRGTEVRLNQKINPPGGQLAILVARLFGHDPAARVREDLRRLKQLLEAGEISTTEGQPSGRPESWF